MPKYIKDLPIREIWPKKGAVFNWLHPLHGPLPDHLGLLEYRGEEFQAALWSEYEIILIALEMLDWERPREQEKIASQMRGNILQTYCWKRRKEGVLECGKESYTVPEPDEDDEEWERLIYRSLMEISVEIAGNSPVGVPIKLGKRGTLGGF